MTRQQTKKLISLLIAVVAMTVGYLQTRTNNAAPKQDGAAYSLPSSRAETSTKYQQMAEEEAEDGQGALTLEGTVITVSDGDTLTIATQSGAHKKIRLYGIDAPELHQKFGPVSKEYLEALVLDKQVTAAVIDKDNYNRYVSILQAGQTQVNSTLLAGGYAWLYGNYCKVDTCRQWQQLADDAKAAGLGLWAQPNPQEPRLWRKQHKTR